MFVSVRKSCGLVYMDRVWILLLGAWCCSMDFKVVSIFLCRVARASAALTESSQSYRKADSWSNLLVKVSQDS